MADYRDPKVTTSTTKRESGMSRWIGIAVAVLAVLVLIAWFTGAFDGADDMPPEAVAPATDPATETPAAGAPATETPATETPATEQPAAPAQN